MPCRIASASTCWFCQAVGRGQTKLAQVTACLGGVSHATLHICIVISGRAHMLHMASPQMLASSTHNSTSMQEPYILFVLHQLCCLQLHGRGVHAPGSFQVFSAVRRHSSTAWQLCPMTVVQLSAAAYKSAVYLFVQRLLLLLQQYVWGFK